jgi:peptidoglycan/LPS O-acetylase OafA/YrhL
MTNKTLSIPRVPVIDGLRGLAVGWIVLGHSSCASGECLPVRAHDMAGLLHPLPYLVGGYALCVDLLFIVSGFVLFLPVARTGSIGDGWSYAVRRAARLVPGFWLFLVLSYVVSQYVGPQSTGMGSWIAHLFFLNQETIPAAANGFGVNPAMWTMSIEVAFSIALPFVARAFYKRPVHGLAIAAVISVGWQVFALRAFDLLLPLNLGTAATLQWQDRIARAFPTYLLHFSLGMCAAIVFVRVTDRGIGERFRSLARQAAAAAAIGSVAIAYRLGTATILHEGGSLAWQGYVTLRAVFLAMLVISIAFSGPVLQALFTNGFMRLLGVMSYGIYLSHLPLMFLLLKQGWHRPSFVLTAAILGLSIVFGIFSFVFIEEPVRAWARGRSGRRRHARPGVVQVQPSS